MSRIYVSSTVSDLMEHRAAVHRALRSLGHDVVAMEDHTASDQRPLERSLADVAASDVHVGIVAWRYGYVPPGDKRSLTELEYRHARALGIPCLMFLLDEDAPWPRSAMDRDVDAVLRLRQTVAEQVAGHFRTADELAAMVVSAVLDAGPGPGNDRIRVVVVYGQDDVRASDDLGRYLTSLAGEGVDFVFSGGVVDDTADAVVLLLSPALVGTGYLNGPDVEWLLSRIPAGQPRLVPVLLSPMSSELLPGALARITPLPARGSIAEYSSKEVAFAEVAEGVRLVCRSILDRRYRLPAAAAAPVRTHHRLVEVFLESGVPTVTFVEPDQFYDLKLALEQPGRGVLIEGPSGVGKTTALDIARAELDAVDHDGFSVLRARAHTDVERIRDLRSWHRGSVAVDDFHRLDPALQADLVDYLKLLADVEDRERKLILVGIPGTGRRLVDLAFDIATRITVLRLGYARTGSVVAMIDKGEGALNVDIAAKAEIVRAAAGSLNVAQILCRHAVALAGVRGTQTSRTLVDTDPTRVIDRAMAMIRPKFEAQVRAFAALDGPHERFCVELLRELAQAEQGALALLPLAQRRPELAPQVERAVERSLLGGIPVPANLAESHLYYDVPSATLVADDPQLTFYLRHLNMTELAVQVGKRSEARRTRVFVSYSHQDQRWLARLRVHLAPLEREGLVDVWADTRIAPGQRWRDEIEAALTGARVAILLVSADFLASDFIRDHELTPLVDAAAADGCTILPVVVAPCLYRETRELEPYESVNAPEQPLSGMEPPAAEQALVDLARRIVGVTRGTGPP